MLLIHYVLINFTCACLLRRVHEFLTFPLCFSNRYMFRPWQQEIVWQAEIALLPQPPFNV